MASAQAVSSFSVAIISMKISRDNKWFLITFLEVIDAEKEKAASKLIMMSDARDRLDRWIEQLRYDEDKLPMST